MALHARRPRRRDGAPAPLARAGRAARRTSSPTRDRAERPLPAVDVADAGAAARRRRALGVGARARQPLAAAGGAATTRRHGRGAAAARGDAAARTPTSRYSRARLPAQAEGEHRPTTRSSFRSSRAGGSPAWGSTRPARPTPTHVGLGAYAGRPSRAACRTTTAGTSAPAPSATSSTSCGCCSRGRSTRGSACATIDVLRPGANLPGIDDPALARRARASAARCRSRARSPDEQAQDERDRIERWAAALSAPVPASARRPRQPRRRLRGRQRPPRANARSTSGRACSRSRPLVTPPIYGRWHALTARLLRARDGTPLDPDDNWVHSSTSIHATASRRGSARVVVQDGQEAFMDAAWSQVGDVLEANRRLRARSSCASSPSSGGRATWRPSSPPRPAARSRSPPRCTDACSTAS